MNKKQNTDSTEQPRMVKSHDIHIDAEYAEWIAELKHRYRSAQVKAAVKMNAEKLLFNLVEAGNPRLLKKLVKNDTEYSLYLEYQMGYNRDNGTSIRKKESLSLYLLASPRTPIQRQQNKETLELAKKIRFEREQEFLDNREGYRLKKEKGINFLDYYQSYISSYTKKDIRMIQIALNRFQDFLAEYRPLLKDFIRPDAITHEMMVKFAEYL